MEEGVPTVEKQTDTLENITSPTTSLVGGISSRKSIIVDKNVGIAHVIHGYIHNVID